MIIKQTRILAGGAETISNYIQGLGENEKVDILYGDPPSVAYYADTAADIHEHTYCIRHIIFSPEKKLDDIIPMIKAFTDEFDIGDRPFAMAVHHKERANEELPPHYHLIIAESDSRGKIMDTSNNFKRNEMISRRLEVEYGHKIQKGRHNTYVIGHMKDNPKYQHVYNIIKNSGIDTGDLPKQAFTKEQQGKAKRLGVDLAKLHNSLKEIESLILEDRNLNIEMIFKAIKKAGCKLIPGDKPGFVYVVEKKTGEILGTLDRLARITMREMARMRDALDYVLNKKKENVDPTTEYSPPASD